MNSRPSRLADDSVAAVDYSPSRPRRTTSRIRRRIHRRLLRRQLQQLDRVQAPLRGVVGRDIADFVDRLGDERAADWMRIESLRSARGNDVRNCCQARPPLWGFLLTYAAYAVKRALSDPRPLCSQYAIQAAVQAASSMIGMISVFNSGPPKNGNSDGVRRSWSTGAVCALRVVSIILPGLDFIRHGRDAVHSGQDSILVLRHHPFAPRRRTNCSPAPANPARCADASDICGPRIFPAIRAPGPPSAAPDRRRSPHPSNPPSARRSSDNNRTA